MTNLSEHFTLAEATKSQTALRHGIDNTPPPHFLPRLVHTAEQILEPARVSYGIPFSPNSWFRSYELERELCRRTIERLLARGRISSAEEYLDRKQHPAGEAVDFEIPGVPNLDLARFIAGLDVFDQVILEFWDPDNPAGGWVHASIRQGGENRRERLTYDGGAYRRGFPET